MRTTTTTSSWGKWIFTGTVLLLLLTPACSRAQATWLTDFDEALKQAAEKEQFIVLDLSASW